VPATIAVNQAWEGLLNVMWRAYLEWGWLYSYFSSASFLSLRPSRFILLYLSVLRGG